MYIICIIYTYSYNDFTKNPKNKTLNINGNVSKLRKGHDASKCIIKLFQDQLSKHLYRQIDYRYMLGF